MSFFGPVRQEEKQACDDQHDGHHEDIPIEEHFDDIVEKESHNGCRDHGQDHSQCKPALLCIPFEKARDNLANIFLEGDHRSQGRGAVHGHGEHHVAARIPRGSQNGPTQLQMARGAHRQEFG